MPTFIVRNRLIAMSVILCSAGLVVFCAFVWMQASDAKIKIRQHQRRLAFRLIGQQLQTLSVRDYGSFKQGGSLLSWRVDLCIASYPIPRSSYPVPTEPWNSTTNLRFEEFGYPDFCRDDHSAFAFAIAGEGTGFDIGFKQRQNLPADLILVLEAPHRTAHWMEPSELRLADLETGSGKLPGSELAGGYHVVFADGVVWRLRPDTPLESLCRLATAERANDFSRDELLGKYVIDRDNQ